MVAVGSIAVAVATVAAVFSAIGFRAVVLAGIDRLSEAAALSACIAIGVATGGLATLLMALLAGAGSDAFHPVLIALYVPGMLAGGVCGSLLPRFLRQSRANPR